ncbi:MAG: hypothetical protein LBK75_07730 [Oscillospiraceae bacterium]|jgi:hypothetical protein|nr:hypothetical protein [Oscillospiraceae bacterium]
MKALNRYYKTLRKTMICSRASKTRFLKQTDAFVEDFLKDKPEATFEDLSNLLGDPAALSETFMETLDPAEIQHHKRMQNIWKILLVALPIVVIVLLCIFVYYIGQAHLDIELTEETVIYLYP